jgi:LEA14-like dessication related protein
LLTQWVVVKAEQMVDGIPAHLRACWQKVGKPEIHEIQVIKGLFEDEKADVFNSWRN